MFHDVVGEVAAIRECGAYVVEECTPVDQEKRAYEVDGSFADLLERIRSRETSARQEQGP